MTIKIPISPGELADKITILEIKILHVRGTSKLKLVKSELALLNKELIRILKQRRGISAKLKLYKKRLYSINLDLWKTEDKIRKLEAEKNFGKEFISAARKIYLVNDKRSEVKEKINNLTGSTVREVKQYTKYKIKLLQHKMQNLGK